MSQRLAIAATLAGLLVIVALVVVILGPGRYDPSPPSLRDDPQPAIPGRILFAGRDNCLHVAEASGAADEEVYCAGDIAFLTWTGTQTIAWAEYGPREVHWTTLDLTTRETRDGGTATFPSGVPYDTSVNGEQVTVDHETGDVYVVGNGERRRIFAFDGPDNRQPFPVSWSPDGEWVILSYYGRGFDDQELWIVSRDGSIAGTLAGDVRGGAITVSWWIDGVGYSPEVPTLPPDLR
jgi:hypothetical protein